MAAAIVGAAAAAAIHAAVAANDAVEGGAQGPAVITTMMAPPRALVRIFSYDFAQYIVAGIGGLDSLDAARPYFEELINSHLPFNVAIEVVFHTTVDDNHALHYIVIPPICCMDGLGTTHDWHTFLERMKLQVQERVDNAENTASGVTFDHIVGVRLTFAPLRDMAALGPHIAPNQAGGSYVGLPKWVQNKKCTLNIENKDFNCFRCCIIADHLGYKHGERYSVSRPEQWSHYTIVPVPRGRKPRGFKVQYLSLIHI